MMYRYKKQADTNHRRTLLFRNERFINSDFGSSKQGKRQNS